MKNSCGVRDLEESFVWRNFSLLKTQHLPKFLENTSRQICRFPRTDYAGALSPVHLDWSRWMVSQMEPAFFSGKMHPTVPSWITRLYGVSQEGLIQ